VRTGSFPFRTIERPRAGARLQASVGGKGTFERCVMNAVQMARLRGELVVNPTTGWLEIVYKVVLAPTTYPKLPIIADLRR
jgi:hypothetical protein